MLRCPLHYVAVTTAACGLGRARDLSARPPVHQSCNNVCVCKGVVVNRCHAGLDQHRLLEGPGGLMVYIVSASMESLRLRPHALPRHLSFHATGVTVRILSQDEAAGGMAAPVDGTQPVQQDVQSATHALAHAGMSGWMRQNWRLRPPVLHLLTSLQDV